MLKDSASLSITETVNPRIRKRLMYSLDYLREMDFFKDYSNLSSEELLKKIFRDEIIYASSWWYEEPCSSFPEIPEPIPHGFYLLDDIEKNQKDWMKKSVFEIDL